MTNPVPTPAPEVPANPSDPAAPETGQPAPQPFDPSSLSPEAQAYLKQQVEAAGFKARDNARTRAAEEARQQLMAEFAQKLGLVEGGETPSAEQLTAHLEEARSDAFRASVELQLSRVAPRVGGDIDAMLDSNRFMADFVNALDETEGAGDMDPRSPEFAALVEAAAATALERNPRLRATPAPAGPRPDPSQGGRGNAPVPFAGMSLGQAIRTHYRQS